MKQRLATKLAFLALLFSGPSIAGESAQAGAVRNEVEEGRGMIRQARIDIVRSELQLTEAEAAVFWPIYEVYREETDVIQDKYAAMATEHVRRYDNADLTNAYADELLETFFDVKRGLLGVQEKFLPRFREALPALKVARLFQLENKINAEIEAQMALMMPLVDAS